jgi:hypothetical protein
MFVDKSTILEGWDNSVQFLVILDALPDFLSPPGIHEDRSQGGKNLGSRCAVQCSVVH